MRYILGGKVYDTEKAKEVIKYIKGIKHEGMFVATYPKYEHTIYKTNKGTFFVHVGKCVDKDISYDNKDYIEIISKEEVKKLLEKLNSVEKYEEIFGEIEEG